MSTKLTSSYFGYVGSTKDALLIIQAILNKQLPLIPRRPHERERNELIKSGNVFIFIEEHSGIKRWTDGISWSPSRILGRFLVYRELDKDNLDGDGKKKKKRKLSLSTEDIDSVNISINHQHGFKDEGLIKKTLSITTSLKELNVLDKAEKQTIHLISYYNANDVLNGKLVRPSESELKGLNINAYLWNAIKESNLGGKIPIEDEAYYFLDNNYQLQNMSLLSGYQGQGQPPQPHQVHQGSYQHQPHQQAQLPVMAHHPHHPHHQPQVAASQSQVHAAGQTPGQVAAQTQAPGQTPQPMYYQKNNFMLPIPSNYDYYPNPQQKEDDVAFINPFTSNVSNIPNMPSAIPSNIPSLNFNLTNNLNSFYHDQYHPTPQYYNGEKKFKEDLHLHHADEHYVYNT